MEIGKPLGVGGFRLGLAIGSIVLSVLVFGANEAKADTCTFTGALSSDFSIAGNWTGCHSGVSSPGNGDSVVIPVSTTTVMTGTKTVSTISVYGTLNAAANPLTVTSTATVYAGGTVTSTSGLLTFTGAVSSTGAIGSTSGDKLFGSTFVNNGVFNVGSGTATTTGIFTNNTSGIINGNSGILSVANDFVSTGTFNAGTGTFRLSDIDDQTITGANFYKVHSAKAAGRATFVTNNVSIAHTLMTSTTASISAGTVNVTVASTTTLIFGSMLTSSSGVWTFADVTSTGDIESQSGGLVFGGTVTNNGAIRIGSGSSTIVGTLTNGASGDFYGQTGTVHVYGNWITGGAVDSGTGTVDFAGTGAHTLGATNFNNVTFYPAAAGTYTLTSSSTILGTMSLGANSTLAVDDQMVLTVIGAISNLGTVTVASMGELRHAPEWAKLTDEAYADATAYALPAYIQAEVKDLSQNKDGSVAETITVVLTVGTDSETLTLTETGLDTGIFRGLYHITAMSQSVTVGNHVLDTSGGTLTLTYTNEDDFIHSTSDTATLSSTVVSNVGGGGGGGSTYIPITMTYQSYTADSSKALNLSNLTNIGVAIHALVKLPDDGNIETQEDSAVYYVGGDGKRHAFPNSHIYSTWYNDFSGVKVLAPEKLATIPLGMNVHYKPGARMVKFTTDPKVYAVSMGGMLRWITSESLTKQLYGDNWNTLIDDMSDAFYTNYSFGSDISSAADFSASSQSTAANLISTDLGL